MIVKITDFASGDVNFVEYSVFGLSSEQLNFLNDNLDEKTCIADDALIIRTYFDDELYPFASDVTFTVLNGQVITPVATVDYE